MSTLSSVDGLNAYPRSGQEVGLRIQELTDRAHNAAKSLLKFAIEETITEAPNGPSLHLRLHHNVPGEASAISDKPLDIDTNYEQYLASTDFVGQRIIDIDGPLRNPPMQAERFRLRLTAPSGKTQEDYSLSLTAYTPGQREWLQREAGFMEPEEVQPLPALAYQADNIRGLFLFSKCSPHDREAPTIRTVTFDPSTGDDRTGRIYTPINASVAKLQAAYAQNYLPTFDRQRETIGLLGPHAVAHYILDRTLTGIAR